MLGRLKMNVVFGMSQNHELMEVPTFNLYT